MHAVDFKLLILNEAAHRFYARDRVIKFLPLYSLSRLALLTWNGGAASLASRWLHSLGLTDHAGVGDLACLSEPAGRNQLDAHGHVTARACHNRGL